MYIKPQPLTILLRSGSKRVTHGHYKSKYPKVWFSKCWPRYMVRGLLAKRNVGRGNTTGPTTSWPVWNLFLACYARFRLFITRDQGIATLMAAQMSPGETGDVRLRNNRNDHEAEEI